MRLFHHAFSFGHVLGHFCDSAASDLFHLIDLGEGLVQVLRADRRRVFVEHFVYLLLQERCEAITFQICLPLHVIHISLVSIRHYFLDFVEESLRVLLGKRPLRYQSIVNRVVMEMELEAVEGQLFDMRRWSFFRVTNLILIIREYLVNVCSEFCGNYLWLRVIFKHEHVAVPSHEEIHELLEVLQVGSLTFLSLGADYRAL